MKDIQFQSKSAVPLRTAGIVLAAFFSLGLLSTFYLHRHYLAQEQIYLEKMTESQNSAWMATIAMFRLATEAYFAAYIDNSETLEVLEQALDQESRDEALERLSQNMETTYGKLRQQGVEVLQFILPSGDTLLRFGPPLANMEDPQLMRSVVRLANTEQVPVRAFEIGQGRANYVAVFSLVNHLGLHLGEVEFSLPLEILVQEAGRLAPQRAFRAILEGGLLNPTLYPEETAIYKPWLGAPQFLKQHLDETVGIASLLPIKELTLQVASSQNAQNILMAGSTGSVVTRVDSKDFVVSFTPIFDLSHRLGGFLVSYTPAPSLALLTVSFLVTSLVAWILLAILAATFWMILDNRNSLARDRAHLRAIANTMAEGLYFIDSKGVIKDVNQAACDLLLTNREDLVGKHSQELLHSSSENGDGLPPFKKILEYVSSGDIYEGEEFLSRKDGSRLPVSLAVSPLIQDGHLTACVATFRDITEEKAAREALEKAREQEAAANRAKSTFLATMSHEIRTPLNAVVGTSSLLLEADLRPDQRDLAETIVSGGEALLSVINDILDYSKIESGRVELERENFDVVEAAVEALDIFGVKAARKNISLFYRINPEVPSKVRGDVSRLRQVLLNIISNAVKFTEEGEILLEIRGASLPNHKVRLEFSIRDTGVGIPENALRRLFSPFEQADASVSRQYGGTGLGLAICKRLIELMDGDISVWSFPGAGTEFRFHVLAEPIEGAPRLYHTTESKPLEEKTVVAAVSHPACKESLCSMLLAWGMEVKLCESYQDLLQALKVSRFDAIFLDGSLLSGNPNEIPPENTPVFFLADGMMPDDIPFPVAMLISSPIRPSALLRGMLSTLCQIEVPTERHESRSASSKNLRLLLAEDNPVNQKVIALMLKKLGCRVDLVSNGREAVEAVQREDYTVVLMDVQMPEMDGITATRNILELFPNPENRPKIIALTANALKGDRENCLAAGMDNYLSKPVRLAELAACIEAVRQGKIS